MIFHFPGSRPARQTAVLWFSALARPCREQRVNCWAPVQECEELGKPSGGHAGVTAWGTPPPAPRGGEGARPSGPANGAPPHLSSRAGYWHRGVQLLPAGASDGDGERVVGQGAQLGHHQTPSPGGQWRRLLPSCTGSKAQP